MVSAPHQRGHSGQSLCCVATETLPNSTSFVSKRLRTGSWNVAVSPSDGFSNETSEERYTASTPVDTREFMSGENRRSDANPDLIRFDPVTSSHPSDGRVKGRRVDWYVRDLKTQGFLRFPPAKHTTIRANRGESNRTEQQYLKRPWALLAKLLAMVCPFPSGA